MKMNHTTKPGMQYLLVGAGLLLLIFSLSACSGGGSLPVVGGGNDEGNPIPTPLPAVDVGEEAQAAAVDSPEGTWENYVRDIIAEQVLRQESKLTMFERYQRPETTAQNLGGIVTDIDLVEDRTSFNTTPSSASANAEFDIRLTFANGDTDTRTCRFPIALEYDQEKEVWFVVNPDALAVFAVCG